MVIKYTLFFYKQVHAFLYKQQFYKQQQAEYLEKISKKLNNTSREGKNTEEPKCLFRLKLNISIHLRLIYKLIPSSLHQN